MVNVWIISKGEGQNLSCVDLMESVMVFLIGGHAEDDPASPAKRVRGKPDELPVARTVVEHWPMHGSKGPCVEFYAASHTTKKSRMVCEQCGVHLHLKRFKQWHKKQV